MVKNSLKYGAVCGTFLIAAFLIAVFLDSNPFVDIRHLGVDVIIMSLFIYFATVDYKKSINEGVLHFWQGMSIGFIVYLLGSLIFVVYLSIHFQIGPDLLDTYVLDATRYLEERSAVYIEKFGEDQYQDQLDAIKMIKPGELTLSSIMKKLIAGLFVTPVISIILRNNK